MSLELRRKFKLKQQFLIMIIPLIFIPIILILFVRIYLFSYLKNQKNEFNVSMVLHISDVINEKFKKGIILNYQYPEFDKFLLNKEGIIFVLDRNKDILYSNLIYKSEKEKSLIDEEFLFSSKEYQNVVNAVFEKSKNYSIINTCFIFDHKFKNNYYQGYYLNNELTGGVILGLKFLYLYPEKKFFELIYPIIFIILFISIIVFIIIILIFYKISDFFIHPLNNLEYVTKKASQGYLNFDIISDSNDELGNLYRNFTDMFQFNKSVLIDIANSSNNLIGYQNSLERSINLFNDKLKEQNNMIIQNTKLAKEFDETINKMVQHIRNAKGIIDQTQNQSDASTNLINEMINSVNNIAETGQQINFIAELLNKIAEKTRLLSVNSAIEASRAGEIGKGFGVVSTEIRKLAIIAKDSAKEIGELVKINDSRIISGINKANEVLGALKNNNSSIKMINQIIEQIDKTFQEEKKNSQAIISADNNFINNTNENLTSISSIDKIRNIFNMDLEKIRDAIKKIVFDVKEKETIRDVKLYIEKKRDKTEPLRFKSKLDGIKDKREQKRITNFRKIRERKSSSKLNSIRAITLYKPKKSILDKFKK